MSLQSKLSFVARLALVVGFFSSSFASATVLVRQRGDWFYGRGYFHNVQGSGGGWAETIDGVEAFQFRETARNDAYVELFDASRDMQVRLYGNAMYLKASGEAQFHHLYDGHWDDRRLFGYQEAAGPAYFNIRTGGIWYWGRPNQPLVKLRETLRNNDQIQLYSAEGAYTVSLLDGEVWMKKDGFDWFKYTSGQW